MLSDADWEKITKAAEGLGLSPHAARKWKTRERIPANRVPDLSRRTKIPMSRLRPDLFGKVEQSAA